MVATGVARRAAAPRRAATPRHAAASRCALALFPARRADAPRAVLANLVEQGGGIAEKVKSKRGQILGEI